MAMPARAQCAGARLACATSRRAALAQPPLARWMGCLPVVQPAAHPPGFAICPRHAMAQPLPARVMFTSPTAPRANTGAATGSARAAIACSTRTRAWPTLAWTACWMVARMVATWQQTRPPIVARTGTWAVTRGKTWAWMSALTLAKMQGETSVVTWPRIWSRTAITARPATWIRIRKWGRGIWHPRRRCRTLTSPIPPAEIKQPPRIPPIPGPIPYRAKTRATPQNRLTVGAAAQWKTAARTRREVPQFYSWRW